MKLAITTYDGRVSPVYEVAKEIFLVVVEGGREVSRRRCALNGGPPLRRVRRLLELGVETLICGGITASQIELLHAVGIAVVDQRAGPVERVLQEYIDGALHAPLPSPARTAEAPGRHADDMVGPSDG